MRALDIFENRAGPAVALDQDCEADGRDHEDYRSPRGQFGEQVRRPAGAKGGLRSLAAKSSGQVRTLALLKEYDRDQEDADKNVDGAYKPDHETLNLDRG
jgi:hypothetical protein